MCEPVLCLRVCMCVHVCVGSVLVSWEGAIITLTSESDSEFPSLAQNFSAGLSVATFQNFLCDHRIDKLNGKYRSRPAHFMFVYGSVSLCLYVILRSCSTAGCSHKALKFTAYFCPGTGTIHSTVSLTLSRGEKENQSGGKTESRRKIESTWLGELMTEIKIRDSLQDAAHRAKIF